MRRRLRALALVGVLSVSLVSGCAPQSGGFAGVSLLEPLQLKEIDQIVAGFMPNYEYINVALVRGGEILLTKTYGQNRLGEADLYASVSKPVTALIFMQLLEQGAIGGIDDAVARYLPQAYRDVQPEPYDDTPITFMHLLTHQSGVPHLSELWNDGKLNLAFRPGTRVQYSTQGFGILGYAMEQITGKPYERLLKEYIGDPVGATSFLATPHFTAPGGQVHSTIGDMALFSIGVMDGQYVSDGSLYDVMFKSYAKDESRTICLGWHCSDLDSHDLTVYHNGSNGRPRAYLRIKPLKRLAVAITGMNASEENPQDFEELAIRLMEVLETPPASTPAAVYPGEVWQQAETPEALGWSSEKLAEARAFADRLGSAAVMIVHRGTVVDAWGDVTRNYNCHSVRKSLLSALYGIYVAEGKIDISKTLDRLGIDDHTPLTEVEKQATVADLLKARSGIYIPAVGEAPIMEASRPERGSHPPGSFWYYNNWDFNALGTIFDQETGEESIYKAFETRIADPIGMQDYPLEDLQYDYEPSSMHPYYGFLLSARDLARFGLLFARGGRWEDEQIIPGSWVAESTTSYSDAGTEGGYGYMWWVASNGRHLFNVVVPDGSFAAKGYRGHFLLVVPRWDLVIVHRFDTFSPEGQVSDVEFGFLVRLILAAAPEALREGIPDTGDRVELSEMELSRLVGQYTLSRCTDCPQGFTPPQEASIELYGEDLVVVAPGEVSIVLIPVTPIRFVSGEDEADYAEVEVDGDRVRSVAFVLNGAVTMVYTPKE